MAQRRLRRRSTPEQPPQHNQQPAPLFAEGERVFYDQDQDTAYRQPPHRKKRKKRRGSDILYTVAIAIFALIFLVCGGLLVKRFLDDRQLESDMAELAGLIDESAPAPAGETAESNAAKFARLVERNPDFIGWISSEGTNLDYPVMQTGTDREDYYLRRDFNGEYDNYGTPYLDEHCTLGADDQSTNLIIYGHNMKTGTVFGSLTGYKEADYYAAHPTIDFDTLYGDATYEVFAAFPIDIHTDTSFNYTELRYIDMDEASFNDFISQVKARSSVDSGITPVYGDQLLTLSTCEYSVGDGRFVVCARKVEG